MSDPYTKFLSTMLLCGSMILTATNACADDARSQKVSYAELNLSSKQGVEKLYEKIRRAAREVCDHGQKMTLRKAMQARECRVEAIANAVAQIKSARLAAHHREEAQANEG